MKFCVIGLGRFGYQVAKTLAENGMEVLGIDANETIIASIRDEITQAVCMQVTDEASLRSIGVDEMDVAIVAVGEDFAQSILITALLKKRLKIKQIVTRAINEIHKEILHLVGADRIVLPEKEIGLKLADALSKPFMELFRLSENFSISQLKAPVEFIGKSLEELELFKKYKVNCIGINKDGHLNSLQNNYIVQEGDTLMFSGLNNDLDRIGRL